MAEHKLPPGVDRKSTLPSSSQGRPAMEEQLHFFVTETARSWMSRPAHISFLYYRTHFMSQNPDTRRQKSRNLSLSLTLTAALYHRAVAMACILKIIFAGLWGFLFLSLGWMNMVSSAPADASAVAKCKGDSIVLTEPMLEATAENVYVFRNEVSVASTNTKATAILQDRLLVDADSRVTLTNLSSNDLGVYRVEVKLTNGKSTESSIRLLVEEPPEIVNRSLLVLSDSSNASFIRLRCGPFISLGYPPVSVSWKDPMGQLFQSTGFSAQYYVLDIPSNVAISGPYCCQLDCHGPNFCCIDEWSLLRQCGQAELQTVDKKDETNVESAHLTARLAGLEKRVSVVEALWRDLNKAGKQDPRQSGEATVAPSVQCREKCDQPEASLDQLETSSFKLQAGMREVGRLQTQLDAMQQSMTEFRSWVQDGVARLNESIQDHRNESAKGIETVSAGLERYLARLQNVEGWLTKTDNRYSQVKDWLSSSHGWISKMSGHMKLITHNMTALGDNLTNFQTAMQQQLSEVTEDLGDVKGALQDLANNANENFNTLHSRVSALTTMYRKGTYGGCPVERGYLLYHQRCLKLYTRRQNYQSARTCCQADGAHLFHLKSRDHDVQPLFYLFETLGKRVGQYAKNGLWVGADDISAEGNFTWTDGTVMPQKSDLWFYGQPDDNGRNEDCVQVRYFRGFVLADESCSLSLEFVCQVDVRPNEESSKTQV